MPLFFTPPARFRRRRLLIVGCGDVGMRVAALARGRWHVLALTRDAGKAAALRALGAVPIVADLDAPRSLGRLAGLADAVVHLAPPPGEGDGDPRSARVVAALSRGALPTRVAYVSTTGVYGDCGGARIDETRPVAPLSARARRRADAEARWRRFGRRSAARVLVLRAPGIYALDRPNGDPRERLRRGTPLLVAADDVRTNHIHADDLARACVAALFRGGAQRVFNVVDDSDRTMGEHFDRVADRFGLPCAPRVTRAEAERLLTPMQMSFLAESRRIGNARLKRELRLRLRYPTVDDGLAGAVAPAPSS